MSASAAARKQAAKPRPRTGDKRRTNQPVKIDRLPASVHESILDLRNRQLLTWAEIELRSAEPIGRKTRGFVDWQQLDTEVLALFPERRIPHTNLHRWYDLRFEQVRRETMQKAAQAKEIAEAFAKANLSGDDDAAVRNAARDTLMTVLCEDGSPGGRTKAAKALIALGDLQQKARANDIKERKVTVDEQALQIKLDQIKAKAGELLDQVSGAVSGARALTVEELKQKVGEIYGIA